MDERRGMKCPTCKFSVVCLALNKIPKTKLDALGRCRKCGSVWFFGTRHSYNSAYLRLYEFSNIINCNKSMLHTQKLLGKLDVCPACTNTTKNRMSFVWYGETGSSYSMFVKTQPNEHGYYAIFDIKPERKKNEMPEL